MTDRRGPFANRSVLYIHGQLAAIDCPLHTPCQPSEPTVTIFDKWTDAILLNNTLTSTKSNSQGHFGIYKCQLKFKLRSWAATVL